MRSTSIALIGALPLLLVACASAASTDGGGKSRCELRPSDSVFAASGPVFRECAVDIRARQLTASVYPPRPEQPRTACYSVTLEFVVGVSGFVETQTVRVVRTTDQEYARAMVSLLPMWKYQPASVDGEPVRQIVEVKRTLATVLVVAQAGSQPRMPPRHPNC